MIVCNAEFYAQQFHLDEENGKLKFNVLLWKHKLTLDLF